MESKTQPSDPFKEWLNDHIKKCPRGDYPNPNENSAFYTVWKQEFLSRNIPWEDLREASNRVARRTDVFLNTMLGSILEEVGKIYDERQRQNEANQETYRRACERSWDCLECGGIGWASRVFVKEEMPEYLFRGALFCRCPAGRWLKNEMGDSEYPTFDDLQNHPKLWVEQGKYYDERAGLAKAGESWNGKWIEVEYVD